MKTSHIDNVLCFSILEIEELNRKHSYELKRSQDIAKSYLDQITILEYELAKAQELCEFYKEILTEF